MADTRKARNLVKGTPVGIQQNFICTIINYSIESGIKGHLIPIVFSPDTLTDSVQASVNNTTIPGASAPQITYTSTGARNVSFSVTFPFDYLPPSTDYKDLEDYLNSFRALVYPKYSSAGNKVQGPHCKLLTSNIEIDGVCTQCSIEYKPDRYANDGSMSANVSLSFTEILNNISNVDATFIANSKTSILSGTQITNITTDFVDTYVDNNQGNIVDDSRCNIALKGNKETTIQVQAGDIIGTNYRLLSDNLWSDPGYNYNHKETYSILKLYGSAEGESITITDVQVKSNNTYSCKCNGKTTSLSKNDTSFYIKKNEIITAFVIYIPYYDVNKYEMSSMKIRYIHVKGV